MKICLIYYGNLSPGYYKRIKQLNSYICQILNGTLMEIIILKVGDIKTYFFMKRLPPVIKGSKRRFLFLLMPGRRFKIIRKLNILIDKILAYLIMKLYKPDIIVGETHLSFDIAYYIKKWLRKAILIVDLHGAYPEEVLYTHKISSHKISEEANWREKCILKYSNVIITQSYNMNLHLINKHNFKSNKVLVFSNLSSIKDLRFSKNERVRIREELKISDDILLFVYSGMLQKWQMHEFMFLLFKKYSEIIDSNARFLVLTNEVSKAKATAKKLGIENKIIVKNVIYNKVGQYLSAGDVAFLLRENNIINEVSDPVKLGEYLACGVPVISTKVAEKWLYWKIDAEIFCIIEENCVNLESLKKIYNFCQKIISNRDLYRKKCRKAVEKFLNVQRKNELQLKDKLLSYLHEQKT